MSSEIIRSTNDNDKPPGSRYFAISAKQQFCSAPYGQIYYHAVSHIVLARIRKKTILMCIVQIYSTRSGSVLQFLYKLIS